MRLVFDALNTVRVVGIDYNLAICVLLNILRRYLGTMQLSHTHAGQR